MQLIQALRIQHKDVVALVGGGGKTTAMFRLAEELAEEGLRVVTTTTTRIFSSQIKLAPVHICAASEEQALRDIREALDRTPHVLVIGTVTREGEKASDRSEQEKAYGIEPEWVDKIAALEAVDVVICEADGSRMRPFKAPGEHEPVIPASTTLLVPVVGIDAVGAILDDAHVHRAKLVAALAGVEVGVTIEPELVARVLAQAQGGLKNRPPHARVLVLVNKAQNVAQLLSAREVASHLLKYDAVDAVAIGAVRNAGMPVAELHQRVGAVILAAGGATRMAGPLKQLLPWGDSTLVRHTVETVQRAQVAETVIVVGKQGDEVEKALAGTSVRVAANPDWAEGRSTSVRAGLNALGPKIAAAIFVNADQPFLTPQVVDTIVQRFAQTLAPIVAPVYEGRTGSPVLFARELFGELEHLQGENGGKEIMQAHQEQTERVNILNARAALDVDTPQDYQAALAEAQAKPTGGIFSTLQPER